MDHRAVPLGRSLLTISLLAALVLAAPLVQGQDDSGHSALRAPVDALHLQPGETADVVFTVVARNQGETVLVAAAEPAPGNWQVEVVPRTQTMPGTGEADIRVLVTADTHPTPRSFDLRLHIEAINGSETAYAFGDMLEVHAVGTELVLGTWENPLGPPLDGPWGSFLLNVVGWLLISILVVLLIDPTLRLVTSRTKTELDDRIIHILRVPVFLALFAFGMKQSLEVFALPGWAFGLLDHAYRILLVIAIVYGVYRIWHEVVLVLGKRMAAGTDTQLDDRLIPVFDKIGGVVIIIVGVFYILGSLGVNLTLFAAGGAVMSLVIAFAAQDTLSNLFSGIFLLIDQPFKEGDDIILDTGEVCEVKRIGLRTTDLYHRANHETIVVPNNLLATNRTINLLKPDNKYKVRVDVGVAYGTDVQLVKRLLMEVARAHPLTLKDEEHQPFVRFQAFGASSLDFSLHVWVGDVYERWLVASDLRERIDEVFAKHTIEIPFPQRVVWQGAEEAAKLDQQRTSGGMGPSVGVPGTHEQAVHQVGGTAETAGDPGGSGGDADDSGDV